MNAAFLLVTSAFLAGGQAPPAAIAAPPAAYVSAAPAGCSSCGGGCGSTASCNDCCEKPGFLDRLKAKFHREGCDGCSAPACSTCAPAPVHHAAPACSSCGSTCDTCGKPSFLERLKAKFKHGEDCGCAAPTCNSCAAPGCSTCGAAPLTTSYPSTVSPAPIALPAQPGETIKAPADGGPMKLPSGEKPLPKPVDVPKTGDAPKTGNAPKNLELTPTSGTRIIETGSKYPF